MLLSDGIAIVRRTCILFQGAIETQSAHYEEQPDRGAAADFLEGITQTLALALHMWQHVTACESAAAVDL